ncbi:MAG: hypothetical protein ACREXT_16595, partial [Gammaproteobacteria bacterium]
MLDGHSLGGHLATVFARLFPGSVASISTYNGLGVGRLLPDGILRPIEDTLGLGRTSFPANVSNYYAEHGINLATSDLFVAQLGTRIPVFNEESFAVPNHFIYKLTDALALCDVMGTIDGNLSLATATQILDAGAANAAASLETVLDALRRLYRVVDLTPTEIGDEGGNTVSRADFHAKLGALRTKVEVGPTATLTSLVALTTPQLISGTQGADGIAYRYALKQLNPFVALGPNSLYDPHNANGELAVYDAASRTGTLTTEWIADRAMLLQAELQRNIQDNADIARIPGAGDTATEYHHYRGGKEEIFFAQPANPAPGVLKTEVVMFADDAGRKLIGSDYVLRDRLYGGGGTDYLEGKSGDDRLEGGKGLDIYNYNGSLTPQLIGAPVPKNDGTDTIRDTDGKGVLRYVFTDGSANPRSTVIADASDKVNSVTWRSADGKFIYVKSGADLVVTINGDASGTLRLKDFRDGDFGIYLRTARANPQTNRDIFGDQDNSIGTDDLGNV